MKAFRSVRSRWRLVCFHDPLHRMQSCQRSPESRDDGNAVAKAVNHAIKEAICSSTSDAVRRSAWTRRSAAPTPRARKVLSKSRAEIKKRSVDAAWSRWREGWKKRFSRLEKKGPTPGKCITEMKGDRRSRHSKPPRHRDISTPRTSSRSVERNHARVVVDRLGQHTMWEAVLHHNRSAHADHPRGLGTMGFAYPQPSGEITQPDAMSGRGGRRRIQRPCASSAPIVLGKN